MKLNNILIQPLITEKSSTQAVNKVYTFEVHLAANKDQISEAIQKLFDVKVDDIKTTIRKGKEKKVGKKMNIKMLPSRKFAYITVKKGTIDLFPQS